MYKNQLQELAQRSCFNLPSYSCIREGPDHAPRFKATVNFNGETFESPCFCSTLRQAEHAAAEVALNTLAIRGPSRALAARVLDETGVYKNLLQETAHRAGLNLPVYTTIRSGPGHVPVFSCTVELAGTAFTGEPARTKKQAQKNAAMSAWSSLKRLAQHGPSSSPSTTEFKGSEDQEQVIVARVLTSLRSSETRSFTRNDPRSAHQGNNTPVLARSASPAMSSLCAMQIQNWAYPSYSPEIAMYQIWHQEQLLHHHQNRLFQLPISPSIPSVAPMFPLVQSVIRPDHCLYFPAIDQELTSAGPKIAISAASTPSLCFSDRSVTDQLTGRSTVTIQEIQEEKTEDSQVVSDSFALGESGGESSSRASEPVQESKFGPVDLQSPNPLGFESARPGPRQQHLPRAGPSSQRGLRPLLPGAPPPVAIRTVGAASPAGFRPQNPLTRFPGPPRMRTGSPSFMAPAVRIRSVVPVCSAPPPRKMPGPSLEGSATKPENEDRDQHNVSKASSELDKLQM